MFQHLVSMCRRAFAATRTNRTTRRWITLNVLSLEERVTPAVVDGFTVPIALPEMVQVAPSREANVRADLFGVGGDSAIAQVDEAEWITRVDNPSADVLVWFNAEPKDEQADEPQSEREELVLFVDGDVEEIMPIEQPMLLPIN